MALDRLLVTERPNATLVLKGYAGTGKTTLVGALVRMLRAEQRSVVLLAPTGRAAKVLGGYAKAPASTIHRRIYRMGAEDDGTMGMSIAGQREAGVCFIVDEASMIGRGDGAAGDRDLLGDLFRYVFMAPGCKLLLIGDPAQLPPVGSAQSPALDLKELAAYGLVAGQVQLTEVVRQEQDSGILLNATVLRNTLAEEGSVPRFIGGHTDVVRTDGHELQDVLEDAYARDGADEVCVICRSNKRAYQYSQQVRARIYDHQEELCPGDRLMVVRNNYYWAGRNGRPELIANGEPITVARVHGSEERHGLRFADITASWWNGTEQRELDVKVMLDVLAAESPALPVPRMQQLVKMTLGGSGALNKGARFKLLREDPYINALQVKYGYAVTCHKAQGGQWNTVFVDQGYVTEEMIDTEYVRWLYTAVTRASGRLYLLNFHPRFWGEE